jgi:hypothetical protein
MAPEFGQAAAAVGLSDILYQGFSGKRRPPNTSLHPLGTVGDQWTRLLLGDLDDATLRDHDLAAHFEEVGV